MIPGQYSILSTPEGQYLYRVDFIGFFLIEDPSNRPRKLGRKHAEKRPIFAVELTPKTVPENGRRIDPENRTENATEEPSN